MRQLTSLLFFAAFACAQAWHDTGHMLVAEIAGRSLTPKARAEIDKLLLIGGSPKTSTLATAACWADDFKNNVNGPWHYINYHFRPDGQPSEHLPLAENVVWAIRKHSEIVRDEKAALVAKADALRYLLHFVGDIHQPMHNVACDSATAPTGDRGGNDFKLLAPPGMQPAPRNLHFIWDMGAGAFGHIDRPLTADGQAGLARMADQLMSQHPMVKFKKDLTVYDPEDWSREGLRIAKEKCYALPENQVPSPAYIEMCQKESQRLVALAGYRLGALLNRLFDPRPVL